MSTRTRRVAGVVPAADAARAAQPRPQAPRAPVAGPLPPQRQPDGPAISSFLGGLPAPQQDTSDWWSIDVPTTEDIERLTKGPEHLDPARRPIDPLSTAGYDGRKQETGDGVTRSSGVTVDNAVRLGHTETTEAPRGPRSTHAQVSANANGLEGQVTRSTERGSAGVRVNADRAELGASGRNLGGTVHVGEGEVGGSMMLKTRQRPGRTQFAVSLGVSKIDDQRAGLMDTTSTRVANTDVQPGGSPRRAHGLAQSTGVEVDVGAGASGPVMGAHVAVQHRDVVTSSAFTTNEMLDGDAARAAGVPLTSTLEQLRTGRPALYQRYLQEKLTKPTARSVADVDISTLDVGEGINITTDVSTAASAGIALQGFGLSGSAGTADVQQATVYRRDAKTMVVNIKVAEASNLGAEFTAFGGLVGAGINGSEGTSDEVQIAFDVSTDAGLTAWQDFQATGVMPGAVGPKGSMSAKYSALLQDLRKGKDVDTKALREIAQMANADVLDGVKDLQETSPGKGVVYERVSNERRKALHGAIRVLGAPIATEGTTRRRVEVKYLLAGQRRHEITETETESHMFSANERMETSIDPEPEVGGLPSEKVLLSGTADQDLSAGAERHISYHLEGKARESDWLSSNQNQSVRIELKQKHIDAIVSGEANQKPFQTMAARHGADEPGADVAKYQQLLAEGPSDYAIGKIVRDEFRDGYRHDWKPISKGLRKRAIASLEGHYRHQLRYARQNLRLSRVTSAADFQALPAPLRAAFLGGSSDVDRMYMALAEPDHLRRTAMLKHVAKKGSKEEQLMRLSSVWAKGAEGMEGEAKELWDSAKDYDSNDLSVTDVFLGAAGLANPALRALR